MDCQTRYSAGALVPSTSMSDTIPVFESLWISEFWSPHAVQGNQAFNNQEFKDYLLRYDIQFRPVTPDDTLRIRSNPSTRPSETCSCV